MQESSGLVAERKKKSLMRPVKLSGTLGYVSDALLLKR